MHNQERLHSYTLCKINPDGVSNKVYRTWTVPSFDGKLMIPLFAVVLVLLMAVMARVAYMATLDTMTAAGTMHLKATVAVSSVICSPESREGGRQG